MQRKKYDEQYSDLEGALDGPAAQIAALLNRANDIALKNGVHTVIVGLIPINAENQQYATIVGVHGRPETVIAFGASIAAICHQDIGFAKRFTMGMQLAMNGDDAIKIGESREDIITNNRPN